MIVTRSWLNEWIDLDDIKTQDLLKILNSIGLEVDSLQSYEIPDGIVFGKVLECTKHPEADKLSVCQVDLGGMVVQIVCGASNVRADLLVAVAKNGTIMPDGLEIKPVKLRGVESVGMICSAKEIGLGDMGEGILELDDSIEALELGSSLKSSPLFDDSIITIELTANRGDCLSVHGVARDLRAALDRPLREQTQKDTVEKRLGIGRILTLSEEGNSRAKVKYRALDLKEFELPFVIKLRLHQLGSKVDSRVDALLSYATHCSGVILKAYDYDRFSVTKKTLAKIAMGSDKSGFVTISSEDKAVASVVGVRQNDEFKASDSSSIILLEASYVDAEEISRKMFEHKIKAGDEYYRSSRGSEPDLDLGLMLLIGAFERFSASVAYGGSLESNYEPVERIVGVAKSKIDEIVGLKLEKQLVVKIFKSLGFISGKSVGENIVVTVPAFRHDIKNDQDLAEEIIRIVGIENIPSKPFVFTEANRMSSDYMEYKKRSYYRQRAAYNGFFESVHFVFDQQEELEKYGFGTIDEGLELLNPIVNTLDTLRSTTLLWLIRSASLNAKNGFDEIKLFELGSVFSSKREESLRLSFVASGEREPQSLANAGKAGDVDFGWFASKLSSIIGGFSLVESTASHKLAHPFIYARVVIDGKDVGEVFRLHPKIEEEFDLGSTILCELEFDKLRFDKKVASPRSKYQLSSRDLSLVVSDDLNYETISLAIDKSKTKEVERYFVVDKYKDASLGSSSSLTIRFILRSEEKTLEESDIVAIIDGILATLSSELGVGLR
ncbi:MAG: phenylalanine--tRNA ligase subunit beta [Sulfuricurvum sp.]